MIPLVAFTPLYDPLSALLPDLDNYWLLFVVPLVIAISVVYKCTRVPDLGRLPFESFKMSFQILLVMAFAALALAGYHALHVRFGIPFLN